MIDQLLSRKIARLALAFVTAVLLVSAGVSIMHVEAASPDQPVEWAGNPGSLRWSLTSLGQGWLVSGDKCDSNDYVMRINKNASADPDRFRIYSFSSAVQRGFSGKSPIGHDLISGAAHLCLGFRDTWNGGGPLYVAKNMFVWVK